MERSEQRSIAEALILASPEPIPLARLSSLIPRCKPARRRARSWASSTPNTPSAGAPSRSGRSRAASSSARCRAFAEYVQASQPERPLRLSHAALETLAVIAYRQPVTRAEIEHVRGVDAGAVLRSLLERNLLRIAGHREVPGRPLLYATSRRFLEIFGLARIEDLPTLRDLAELAPRRRRRPSRHKRASPRAQAAARPLARRRGGSRRRGQADGAFDCCRPRRRRARGRRLDADDEPHGETH